MTLDAAYLMLLDAIQEGRDSTPNAYMPLAEMFEEATRRYRASRNPRHRARLLAFAYEADALLRALKAAAR